jgi:thiol-disulfide isomerase/thioredoxin
MANAQDRSNRTWLAIGAVLILFWVGFLALFGPGLPEPSLEGSGTGEPASYDWPLRDLNGQPATLASFKGKPVFLNLWSTSCPPCIREMPSIARLAEDPRLRGKGIAFVCVATDPSLESVKAFLEGRPWKMTFFLADSAPPVFLTDGIPATFIIAPDGRIVASQEGPAEWDNPEAVELLERLAGEMPSP